MRVKKKKNASLQKKRLELLEIRKFFSCFSGRNHRRTLRSETRAFHVQETRAVHRGRRNVSRSRNPRRRRRSVQTGFSVEIAEIRDPPQTRCVPEESG